MPPETAAASREDLCSLSNYASCVTTSLDLDWTLDFEKCSLFGSLSASCKVLVAGTPTVDFDSVNLDVSSIKLNGKEVLSEVVIAAPNKILGTKISVPIPSELRKEGDTFSVLFTYKTSPEASAIQWLSKEATADKQFPYVFTQCQAIHARSLLPCQDTPGVKTPYTASVKAPAWCTVLMSAVAPSPREQADIVAGVFRFRQNIPTPAYLIALAGGKLEPRVISQRVSIWSEPSVVDKAAFDFSQTEDFLAAAEAITCPYMWGRYDVLCLPPSFPYGGVENPCLTFATPTLLTGDKSLADVIAHEIAHSWTGNLVTNATWSHFWLNEGWTMWLQRKIEERVKGGVDHLKISAQSGWHHLREDVKHMTETGHENFTSLVCPLNGGDPDDAFSSVPYEKGFNLLYKLECIVGKKEFEGFAKKYITNFAQKTVTSADFKNFFLSSFVESSSTTAAVKEQLAKLDWNELFFGIGMPTGDAPDFSNSLSTASEALGQKWIALAKKNELPPPPPASSCCVDELSGFDDTWATSQKIAFLDSLATYVEESNTPLTLPMLEALDRRYALTACPNSEIKHR